LLWSPGPPRPTLFPYTTLFRSCVTTDRLLEGLARREPAALARAISLVENQRDGFERVLSHTHGLLGRGGTRRVGITGPPGAGKRDRKSTRLNSSHGSISYAVFC